MEWLLKLSGISKNNLLNISIPKEKLVNNIKSKVLKTRTIQELNNIEDIIYHAVFREKRLPGFCEELHVIEVKLYEPQYVKTIAEAFQKAIPYTLIIIFSAGEKYLLFNSYNQGEVREYQFSDWVYEEEITTDFDLGSQKDNVDTIAVEDDFLLWLDLRNQISELFEQAEYSQYICLRHFIDILKIREIQQEKDYVRPILSRILDNGMIEYFDDTPFITWSDADSLYRQLNPHSILVYGVEDERYGIDTKFKALFKDDFTTQHEVFQLLREAETFYHTEWPPCKDNPPNPYDDDEDSYD